MAKLILRANNRERTTGMRLSTAVHSKLKTENLQNYIHSTCNYGQKY